MESVEEKCMTSGIRVVYFSVIMNASAGDRDHLKISKRNIYGIKNCQEKILV
jgi:hypothetical protein